MDRYLSPGKENRINKYEWMGVELPCKIKWKRGQGGTREGIGRETAKIKVHFSRSTKT